MANLDIIPLQDGFETTLAQAYDGQLGTFKVNESPTFTFTAELPSTYAVLNPGKTNMQIVEFNAYDPILKTITVSNITLEKGSGIASTAENHTVQSKVIISDNYEFWKKILTAINSKLGNDGSNGSTIWDLTISGSNFRIRKDGDDMKFTDDNNAEISLSTLAAAAGADTKVAISTSDTTPSQLEDKLIESDGITLTKNNPAGNENFTVKVNINDITIHSTESDFGLVVKASDAEALAGVEDTKYITSKQASDNYETEGNPVVGSITIDDSNASISIPHGCSFTPNKVTLQIHKSGGPGSSGAWFGKTDVQSAAGNDGGTSVTGIGFIQESGFTNTWAVTSVDGTNVNLDRTFTGSILTTSSPYILICEK